MINTQYWRDNGMLSWAAPQRFRTGSTRVGMADDLQFTVDGDGETADLTLPRALVEALGDGDEPAAEIVADVAQMGFTSRAHMLVHHDDGEVPSELEAAEERARELFEQRFGTTYAEATGHDH